MKLFTINLSTICVGLVEDGIVEHKIMQKIIILICKSN